MELTNTLMPYIIAGGITIAIAMIIYFLYIWFQNTDNKASYDDQLEELLEDEYVVDEAEPEPNIVDKWNVYWGKIAKDAGIGNYAEQRDNTAGRDIILFAMGVTLVISVLLQNVIAGLAIAAAAVFIASGVLRGLSNRKEELLNNQLPGFLFALKSNLAANETIEKGIIKVVDNMPSPLYEDLYIIKSRLQANSSFVAALEELKHKTTSRDLEFLCACMIQAVKNGENIEDQITTIQKVLEERQKVSQEITRSLKTVSPATIIASVVIPASFLLSYYMDPTSQEFWFQHPVSWIAFGVVGALWGLGIWLTRKMASNIRNL